MGLEIGLPEPLLLVHRECRNPCHYRYSQIRMSVPKRKLWESHKVTLQELDSISLEAGKD
jgi:hypothetical protein